jgi:LL-diaminopimelate aminotransferase
LEEKLMSESYIQGLFAGRIGGSGFGKETVIYKFEKIKRAKRQALHDNPGVELIDLGVGEPDWAADPAHQRRATCASYGART